MPQPPLTRPEVKKSKCLDVSICDLSLADLEALPQPINYRSRFGSILCHAFYPERSILTSNAEQEGD